MSEERLPTRKQLLNLSRRGLVAFAARCLRRVQMLPGYQETHQDIAQIIQVLWQFPRDPSDEPDTARYRSELGRYWNQESSPLVVIVCETIVQALSEAGGNAPRWAHDVAVAADNVAWEWGRDISALIRSDFQVLCQLAPGPFPEVGGPFDETLVELALPRRPDGGEPPRPRQA